MTLKPRANIIRSTKQGIYQSLQKGLMSSKKILKSRESAIVAKHAEDALLLKCKIFPRFVSPTWLLPCRFIDQNKFLVFTL